MTTHAPFRVDHVGSYLRPKDLVVINLTVSKQKPILQH